MHGLQQPPFSFSLDDAGKEGRGGGHIVEPLFTALRCQFQPVTICHQQTFLLMQPLFQLVPVFPANGWRVAPVPGCELIHSNCL